MYVPLFPVSITSGESIGDNSPRRERRSVLFTLFFSFFFFLFQCQMLLRTDKCCEISEHTCNNPV